MKKYFLTLFAMLLVASVSACVTVTYRSLVLESKSIPDVSVRVRFHGDGIFRVNVFNKTPDKIALLWQKSAYLSTKGDSVRLIPMVVADDFPADDLPAINQSAIARSGNLEMYFVGKSWIDLARRGITPGSQENERRGKLILAFMIDGKEVTWTGDVTFFL